MPSLPFASARAAAALRTGPARAPRPARPARLKGAPTGASQARLARLLGIYLIAGPAEAGPAAAGAAGSGGRPAWLAAAEAALGAGVTLVQYRNKDPRASLSERAEEAAALLALARPSGVPLIINDDVALAERVRAAGVHLGAGDGDLAAARRALGARAIVGRSVEAPTDLDAPDLRRALASVDYLGAGPVFATASKPDAAPLIGIAGLARIAAAVPLPVVAIGGLGAGNFRAVLEAGAVGGAFLSGILAAGEPGAAAALLAAELETFRALP